MIPPRQAGSSPSVRWPAEWEPQEAVWLSWPLRDDLWTTSLAELQQRFARLAATIGEVAVVHINARAEAHEQITGQLAAENADPSRWRLFAHPTNDVWCRDHGPIFVRAADGKPCITDWRFNAWGGKFPPWNLDDRVPELVASALDLPRLKSSLVLEGGAIEGNGDGLLISTEAVLMNSNRNPGWSRADIEAELARMLGARSVFWLGKGLEGDDTDGHIDDMVRFIAPGAVVAVSETDERDPNHRVLCDNHERLQDLRTCEGSRVEVVDLPLPEPVAVPGDGWRLPRLPASHANFLICNEAVLVPTFNQPRADDRALGILRECFGDRKVIGFDARSFLVEGGAIHCLTQQQPAFT